MAPEIHMLLQKHRSILDRVAPGVFDHPLQPELVEEFLQDPRHHIAVAQDDGIVIGFASGIHYIHPDKSAELFVNEVGVAPTHRNRGIGTALLKALFSHAEAIGCREAWVLTEAENVEARRMYAKAGGSEVQQKLLMVSFRLNGNTAIEPS